MKKILPLLFLILPIMVSAQEEEEMKVPASEQIQSQLHTCLDTPGNETTAGSIGCMKEAYLAYMDAIDLEVLALKELLPESVWFELLAAQELWHEYREQEEESADSIFGAIPGSMSRIYAASRKAEIVRSRLLELEQYQSDWRDLYWEEED